MKVMRPIFTFWIMDLQTLLFIAGVCVVYLYAIDFKLKNRSAWFFTGIFLICFCTFSPLHFIGMHYLFSIHMLTHVILLLLAGPLLIAGIPRENKFRKQLLSLSRLLVKYPGLSWFAGVLAMWVWHIPFLFDLGMQNMLLMHLQLFTLLITGFIFAWPIMTPYPEYRIHPLQGVLYLSSACVFCSILGLLITFAPLGTFRHYLEIPDGYGYLMRIRNQWNISTKADQQAAGLIMWVPCCIIYLSASMLLLLKWFETGSEEGSNGPAQKKAVYSIEKMDEEISIYNL